MSTSGPVFEKSRSVEDLQHMRLMALLGELVRDKGVMKAAKALDVDYRTLTGSLERERLSRRMRVALEKALLEGGGSPAGEQRERNDNLEEMFKEVDGKVDVLGKDLHKGLSAVQGDVKALRGDHEGLARQVAQLASGGTEEGAQEGSDGKAGPSGKPRGRSSLRREFPDLVTLELADDDDEVFGAAWPLIVEWRGLKASHPDEGKSLSWLRTEERFLAVELALLEDHGMTLPPETYPLQGFDRNGQINWRRTALSDTRRALRKRELLRWVRRALSVGLWWK